MNWKQSLSNFFIYAGINFAFFSLSMWKKGETYFNSHHLIESALEAIAIGLVVVGLYELNRGGHRKISRIYGVCFIVWAIVFLISAVLLYRNTTFYFATSYLFYLSFIFFAIPFPLALYLNRSPKKQSVAQLMIDNAK